MMRMVSRKGSALLIVLGMVAFMVVSAVAFSAYMRYSRLPSSYLRQSIASRMLAKAALAKAIDAVDAAVGNNPHPGVGNIWSRGDNKGTAGNNFWIARVFIGGRKAPSSLEENNGVIADRAAYNSMNLLASSASETASPLCYEALAYLPPSLVNEVRYYSRKSHTAVWQPLDFDAGRYVFTAVDVSDYLDVNRLTANYARSSDKDTRLSLAHLFENATHTASGAPASWDSFMANYFHSVDSEGVVSFAGKVPAVSLADLNLAMGDSMFGNLYSPFCQYDHSGLGNFYSSPSADRLNALSSMTFVTDSYMTTTNTVNPAGDIALNDILPGVEADRTDGSQSTVKKILSIGSKTYDILADNVTGLDLVSLWDYLDENNTPASLALPTVERNPMIIGLQPEIQLKFTPKQDGDPVKEDIDPETETTKHYYETFKYRLQVEKNTAILGMQCLFPFLREKEANQNAAWSAEFALRVGFTTATAANLRTRVNNSGDACGFVVKDENEFTMKDGCEKGAFKGVSVKSNLNVPEVSSEDNAVINADGTTVDFQGAITWSQGDGGIVFWVKREVLEQKTDLGGWQRVKEETKDAWVNDKLYPVGDDLVSVANGWSKESLMDDNFAGIVATPVLSVTARIKRGGQTVDLVPASSLDDKKYNGINQDQVMGNLNYGVSEYPVLVFLGDQQITFSRTGFSAGTPVVTTFKPSAATQAIFCPDPRWNFAPENFFQTAEPLDTVANWFKTPSDAAKIGLGVAGRDGDIFMGISNQGYLQSVSEISFLPRTSIDFGGGDEIFGNTRTLLAAKLGGLYPVFNNGNLNDLAHGDLMWRTYRLYKKDGYARDAIYEMGLYNGDNGLRINPYTDSTNVMMAAMANTPCSWWAAAMNSPQNETKNRLTNFKTAERFNQKYALNGINADSHLSWNDLQGVAGRIMAAVRRDGFQANPNWQATFDNLDWGGIDSDMCGYNFGENGTVGGTSDDLYEVERKTLFGFWRDCFDVRQQLFLIFVRAEPTMMGGKGAPQLGSRAVALVWRDPYNRSSDPEAQPHRTRVLFYRQFE